VVQILCHELYVQYCVGVRACVREYIFATPQTRWGHQLMVTWSHISIWPAYQKCVLFWKSVLPKLEHITKINKCACALRLAGMDLKEAKDGFIFDRVVPRGSFSFRFILFIFSRNRSTYSLWNFKKYYAKNRTLSNFFGVDTQRNGTKIFWIRALTRLKRRGMSCQLKNTVIYWPNAII